MSDADGLDAVRAYADHHNDGIVQLSFTLPIPYGSSSKRAAVALASKMGFVSPEVVHYQKLTKNYTYFVVYGRCPHAISYVEVQSEELDIEYMSEADVDAFVGSHIRRKIVVVGASTGTDTHSVGIDAMLNIKGFDGHHGLEAYKGFEVHNLGSQVPNSVLVSKAIEVNADAILVSQTVTQQNLHIHNLTNLVDIVEAEGIRKKVLLICGGPRVSNELSKELGYDAGFSKGCYPNHVATFIVQRVAALVQADHDAQRAI